MNTILVIQDTAQWWCFVNTVTNLNFWHTTVLCVSTQNMPLNTTQQSLILNELRPTFFFLYILHYQGSHTSSYNTATEVTTTYLCFDVLLTVLYLSIFISVFNQVDAQNLFHNKFYFMPLHVSSTCAHHREVKIAFHSLCETNFVHQLG